MTNPLHAELATSPNDPAALLADVPLTEDEASYVEAARAPNTLRGYRSDWSEFTAWCTRHRLEPLPAGAATISGYLTELARAGAKVGTMSRRLSAIRFAHQLRDLPDPTIGARVVAVWEGIRRTHGAPPDQAKPLMPPQLLDVLDACPTTRTWKTRPAEPDCDAARRPTRGLLPRPQQPEPASPPPPRPGCPPPPGVRLSGSSRRRAASCALIQSACALRSISGEVKETTDCLVAALDAVASGRVA